MHKYFLVSFQYSESVYCSNIATAASAEDVQDYYGSKYAWCSVQEATPADLEEAKRKNKPIINL